MEECSTALTRSCSRCRSRSYFISAASAFTSEQVLFIAEVMKRIAILGSTGSIGKSTLNIVESFPDRFSVVSMAAGNNVELAFEQARRWHPQILSMATTDAASQVQDKLNKAGLGSAVETVHGSAGSVRVATHPDADFVVSAIVGVAGLRSEERRVG